MPPYDYDYESVWDDCGGFFDTDNTFQCVAASSEDCSFFCSLSHMIDTPADPTEDTQP